MVLEFLHFLFTRKTIIVIRARKLFVKILFSLVLGIQHLLDPGQPNMVQFHQAFLLFLEVAFGPGQFVLCLSYPCMEFGDLSVQESVLLLQYFKILFLLLSVVL